MMLRITRSAFEVLVRHAEKAFPEECCGCLSSPEAEGPVTTAHPCTNIQNRLHEEDPKMHPRTARDAYHLDERELFRIQQELDDTGRHLRGIFHSHPNEESYFSAEDKRRALCDDEPLWPDAHYLIASIRGGRLATAKSFTWSPAQKDFIEEPMEVLADDA